MARRKRGSIPVMLFWSKRDQLRFCESVERFESLVNDMERILAPAKRKKQTHEAKAAAAAAASNGEKGAQA